jgi:type IV pilus secretin PilQ/predicted competence protein
MRAIKVFEGLLLTSILGLAVLMAPVAQGATPSATQRVGLQRTGPGTFSIDVEGADVRTVCKAVAEFSGRNVVVAGGVKAVVTVSLQNVGWEEALRTILRTVGLDYVDEEGILRVDDAGRLRGEQLERESAIAKSLEVVALETRIIKLNYANAAELSAPLQASLTRRGTILTEKRTNALIVSDLPVNLDKVEKMATELDSATPQIEITAKLVDVDSEALRDLGIEWNVGAPEGGPEFWQDVPGPTGPLHPGNDDNNALGGEHKTRIDDPATRINYGISKNWGFIEAQLQVLEQNRKAHIISNPRITTVDNREAKILVGQKIPLIVQDVAGNPVSQLQTIGVQLKVTPHLTQDKKVIMDLHPEVSELATQSTVQGGVVINTSEADTRVMVDDGQTAVIGGLIRINDSDVRRGVPFLKDVPGLGYLFRSSNMRRQSRELIIFVTPRIVGATAKNE